MGKSQYPIGKTKKAKKKREFYKLITFIKKYRITSE